LKNCTLLVPCYNAARYLPRLMEYVRALETPFDRILAYDDGSTDDTVPVARSLDLEIITPNKNGGVSVARNRLASAASTEWIHFHDADDRIHPAFLTRLAPLADASADAVSCDADWIGETDGALHVAWRYDPAALATDPAAHLLTRPLGLNSSLIRRSAWLGVGGCDETLAMWEDADIHFRLALSGARWRHHAEVLTWSLRDSSSFSHNYRRNWRCRLQALEKYTTLAAATHLRPVIAAEAETVAGHLLSLGDRAGTRSALALASRLGRIVPTTRNPLLRAARVVLPPIFTLALQQRLRRAAPTAHT